MLHGTVSSHAEWFQPMINWYIAAGGEARLFKRALATCTGKFDYLVVDCAAVRASPYGGLSRYTVEEAV